MAEGNVKPPVDEAEQDMPQRLERDNLIPPRTPAAERDDGFRPIAGLVDRVAALENAYRQQNGELGQMRAYLLSLGKQEDYQKTVMERNIRAAAADLAIKSATDETKADAATLTTMAGAWLVWLKGGDQNA